MKICKPIIQFDDFRVTNTSDIRITCISQADVLLHCMVINLNWFSFQLVFYYDMHVAYWENNVSFIQ